MSKITAKSAQTSQTLALTYAISGAAALAVNTIVPSSVSKQDKVAMRIRCIEYYWLQTAVHPCLADGDIIRYGFSFLASQPSAGNMPTNPGVIDYNLLCRQDITAIGVKHWEDPLVTKDLTLRYPDGILVHPSNLYWWNYVPNQIGAPTAAYVYIMLYYTMEDITQEMWDDMWMQMFVTQAG